MKCVAAGALTVMVLLVPVILVVVLSLAVTFWLPAVVNVALNVPTPLVNVPLAGSTVALPLSLLLKLTVPL